VSAAAPPAVRAAVALPGRRRLRWVVPVLVALGVLLAVRLVVAEPFSIPSHSMAPTLASGDHVLVDKLAYRGASPHRGDLVVFRAPGTEEIMLKRVVAVGGQRVGIEDGVLVVDGRRPSESYTDPDAIDSVFYGPVEVPAGTVFVLGDNRLDSADSRKLGPVPTDSIIGKARTRIWPPSRWGGIG
jgi:signal peptidase I